MNAQTVWVGEERLCLVTVSGLRDVPGFGALPRGRVTRGRAAVRGARARLLRHGVVVAEDLRIGALFRESRVASRLEAEERVDVLNRCVLAVGHRDVRRGDQIQVYARAGAGVPADQVPGYQDALAHDRRLLGRAEVREVSEDSLAGPVAHAVLAEGALTPGDRVRVVRDGRPVIEALRLLALTDADGGPLNVLAAEGAGAALLLGRPDVRPGDVVEAFDVPAPRYTEGRKQLLTVLGVRADGMVATARVQPDVRSPSGGEELAVGHRARVLRGQVVVADGLAVGHVRRPGITETMAADYASRARAGWFEVGVDLPGLRERDEIEPYEVLPADHEPAPAVELPESRRFMVGVTVGFGACVALSGFLAAAMGAKAWQAHRTPPPDDAAGWPEFLALSLFFATLGVMFAWCLVLGHRRQRLRRGQVRRTSGSGVAQSGRGGGAVR
ncbi:hypothetical protein [Actinomadura fibrosa]|uniref:Uncharacterized protein n=1 Tax=Actinomadura fibrosa TaxID=111802 RepID=A0ABW2XZ77_9ACTN|nr:hypothetical protein [Actinomadura fibrosa]